MFGIRIDHVTLAVPALLLALASSANAQVVVQGEVSVGASPYVEQGPANTVQPVSPQAYGSPSPYVQQPVGQPQPVRYVHRSRIIPGLLIPGIVLLVGGYVTQAVGAPLFVRSLTADQLGFAYIPILGPWVQLGLFRDLDFALRDGVAYFSIFTGIAQTLGLVLTILGATIREQWEEPVYALTDDPLGPSLAFDGARATLRF